MSEEAKDANEAIELAEKDMNTEERGAFKKIKGMLGSLQTKGRAGVLAVNAVKAMTKATTYAQEAKRICQAIDSKEKKPEQFKMAAKIVRRGINNLAEVIHDFPTTANSVSPLRDKLLLQETEIKEIAKKEFGIDV